MASFEELAQHAICRMLHVTCRMRTYTLFKSSRLGTLEPWQYILPLKSCISRATCAMALWHMNSLPGSYRTIPIHVLPWVDSIGAICQNAPSLNARYIPRPVSKNVPRMAMPQLKKHAPAQTSPVVPCNQYSAEVQFGHVRRSLLVVQQPALERSGDGQPSWYALQLG
jgi:hypothetical protein